jgi:hypothetical protein
MSRCVCGPPQGNWGGSQIGGCWLPGWDCPWDRPASAAPLAFSYWKLVGGGSGWVGSGASTLGGSRCYMLAVCRAWGLAQCRCFPPPPKMVAGEGIEPSVGGLWGRCLSTWRSRREWGVCVCSSPSATSFPCKALPQMRWLATVGAVLGLLGWAASLRRARVVPPLVLHHPARHNLDLRWLRGALCLLLTLGSRKPVLPLGGTIVQVCYTCK